MAEKFRNPLGPEYYDALPKKPSHAVSLAGELALYSVIGPRTRVIFTDRFKPDKRAGEPRIIGSNHRSLLDAPFTALSIFKDMRLRHYWHKTRPWHFRRLTENPTNGKDVPVLASFVRGLGGIAIDRASDLAEGLAVDTGAVNAAAVGLMKQGQSQAIWLPGRIEQGDPTRVSDVKPGALHIAQRAAVELSKMHGETMPVMLQTLGIFYPEHARFTPPKATLAYGGAVAIDPDTNIDLALADTWEEVQLALDHAVEAS